MVVRPPLLLKSSRARSSARSASDLHFVAVPAGHLHVAGDVGDDDFAARIGLRPLLDFFRASRLRQQQRRGDHSSQSHSSVLVEPAVGSSLTSASNCSSLW